MKQYEATVIFRANDEADAEKAVKELEASDFVAKRNASVTEAEEVEEV